MAPKQKKINVKMYKIDLSAKNIFIGLFSIFFIIMLFSSLGGQIKKAMPEKPITSVLQEIKEGKVSKLEILENTVFITYKEENKFARTTLANNDSVLKLFKDFDINPNSVEVKVQNNSTLNAITGFLINILPVVAMVAFFFFVFRQARGAQDNMFSFGQSKAKRFNKDLPKNTFADVAGVDDAKLELSEIVDFLKNPEKYKKLGARTPKGVLLVGPAGTGKTLLARAVAGEASVPFFSIAGSEFMEMLVGIGAARVRDLFATAKASSPSIIFIDEIDAIGRSRSSGVSPGHDEREQTLNQILVEMDGFSTNERVVVIAATNRGDILDSALLRPGRFDRRVLVQYPELDGRRQILAIHAKGKPFADNVNWEKVAKRTVGFTGADLENMLNEAAILAARNAQETITASDIEEAATKVKMGPEKKRMQTDDDKKLTAYHEAGHALVAHFMPKADPVHRISIVSRGMALGFTLIHPDGEKTHQTKQELLEHIAVMMGGRAAEEIVFNEVTTGASNDFNQATRIAKAMVTEYGMSGLGTVNLTGSFYDITNYNSGHTQNSISEVMQEKVDAETSKILDACYGMAKDTLTKHRKQLDAVTQVLLEKENIDGEEFEEIVGKKNESKA
jgi:cell division protease FtsH